MQPTLVHNHVIRTSKARAFGRVDFPPFYPGEKFYMVPFVPTFGLPDHMVKWQVLVDDCLRAVSEGSRTRPHLAYLTIDCRLVGDGQTHRRPGLHVEGYWNAASVKHKSEDDQQQQQSEHKSGSANWSNATLRASEATILVSSELGCAGYTGDWTGEILDRGDCSKIDTSGMSRFNMEANTVYCGNAAFLHEPLPIWKPVVRALVRITCPGWEPIF